MGYGKTVIKSIERLNNNVNLESHRASGFVQQDIAQIISIKNSDFFKVWDKNSNIKYISIHDQPQEEEYTDIPKTPMEEKAVAPTAIDATAETISAKQLLEHKGWIYYIPRRNNLQSYQNGEVLYEDPEKDMSLYKMKPDGGQKTKIVDGFVSNLAVFEDWIFYTVDDSQSGFPNTVLYKMKLDGTEKTKITDGGWIGPIYIVDNTLIYEVTVTNADLNYRGRTYVHRQLYQVNLNGTNKKLINNDNINLIHVEGDTIYYRIAGEVELYSMKLDGTNIHMVSSTLTRSEVFEEDGIYLVSRDDEYRIVKINRDGSGKKPITNNNQQGTKEMFIKDDWIYYIDSMGNLFRINTDGNGYKKMNHDSDVYDIIGILQDWIYYIDKNGSMKRMKLEGTMDQDLYIEQIP